MTNIKGIFLEYDFPTICDYDKIENVLSQIGFHIEY
ncbi:hypothetical protein SAMN06265220_10596 [Flavobacterium nitrogenifigens]|uniref:Uncharacterized protein n=1 Tax=Flavobacterium nitrogenifigens TaxID=1617283 RepID=A0A521ETV1_9FLAO|nr:hypothetical protein SAMN06265220_10596 [Flavobacterium nitrogenifigens]